MGGVGRARGGYIEREGESGGRFLGVFVGVVYIVGSRVLLLDTV